MLQLFAYFADSSVQLLVVVGGTNLCLGGFLKVGLGNKGNNTGMSVLPIFFPFIKRKEYTLWCSFGAKSFLIHFVLNVSSCGNL